MKYFDSHAHYYDARFTEECEKGVGDLLDSLFAQNISGIINIGTSVETSASAVLQARSYERMYTAIGIHPTDGQAISDLSGALSEIERMATDPSSKCVAIGEIGLDYHYPDTDKDKQIYLFEEQLEMARRLHLPVSIHDRDAHRDTLEILKKHVGVKGVLHSFSGSAEMAKELLGLGYYISFSGVVTFTNARKTKEAALIVPKDRLLIETDCPYLAPHPLRGSLNHSGYLKYTNAVLASLIGMEEEACARQTEENACRLFRISL